MESIKKEKLVADIRVAGVAPGSILVLHSSMKSIGRVEEGPNAVINAFLEVLGCEGTLLVPTFTYGEKHRNKPFDPETSESVTGLLTETFRKRSDAVRSVCPVHSVAAIGKHAHELTRDHMYNTTLGRYSPFHMAAKRGGLIMLVGCDHNSNSTIHVAESLAEVPFNYVTTPANPSGRMLIRQKDGKVKEIQLTEFTGCSNVFARAEEPLRQAGVIRDGKVGKASVQLMKGMDVLKVLVPILQKNPDWLLCDNPECAFCPVRKEFIRNYRPSPGH